MGGRKSTLEAVEVMTVQKKLVGSYKGRKVLITGNRFQGKLACPVA